MYVYVYIHMCIWIYIENTNKLNAFMNNTVVMYTLLQEIRKTKTDISIVSHFSFFK